MDMMTADLRQMAPSLGNSNSLVQFRPTFFYCNSNNPVNFYAGTNKYGLPAPVQSLPGSAAQRTNVLENFFILSRGNLNGSPTWFGTGYVVFPPATNSVTHFTGFYMTTNVEAFAQSGGPVQYLYVGNLQQRLHRCLYQLQLSHLLDGVVDLRVRAYDLNGVWMTNGLPSRYTNVAKNVFFLPSTLGGAGFYMFSNTLPASVEIELGVLEDRALQRAETWPNGSLLQSNYLAQQAGKVHIFRQRRDHVPER